MLGFLVEGHIIILLCISCRPAYSYRATYRILGGGDQGWPAWMYACMHSHDCTIKPFAYPNNIRYNIIIITDQFDVYSTIVNKTDLVV